MIGQRKLFVLMVLIALLFPVAAWQACRHLVFGSLTPITAEQGEQLREGMTKEQVIALLGPPHEPTRPDWWLYKCDFPSWTSDALKVGFDANGRVNWISR